LTLIIGYAAFRDARVLITGGVGLIGSSLARRLVGLGADVTLIDSMVPEVIRFHTPLSHMRRTAVADFELNGKKIKLISYDPQSNMDLYAQYAQEAALKAQDSNIRTLQAGLDRVKADLARAKADFDRAKQLVDAGLMSRQEFDTRKAAFDSFTAAIPEAESRVAQARANREQFAAQLSASQRRIGVSQANLRRASDALQRTQATAPIDGVVTNLPVRVGETVVPGIQNSPASLIMTIADMSLITAEVKVDETDIVNVKLDQVADITIDAIPGKTFKGHVIEIGNTAILRSTGLAASQSAISSQEAKDFKVVIALDNPPDEIRPGLSSTAKIVTSTRSKAVSIPIQALTVRTKGDLEKKEGQKDEPVTDPALARAKKEEVQGVFVIRGERAVFQKVDTGITGATDIEVLSGLNEGDEIITGSYKVIRTLRNEAKIKVDNKSPVKAES